MKIGILGYGKMAKAIAQEAIKHNHEITLIITSKNLHDLTIENLQKCDVILECSTPQSAWQNIQVALQAKKPLIIGTTGWYEHLEDLKKQVIKEKASVLVASNFSIGVNIVFKLNELLAKLTTQYPEYKISISETHHTKKLDAPSGTAISLANQILKNNSRKTHWENLPEIPNIHIQQEILPIFSERKDDIPGTHRIVYESEQERIEINHIAHNREGFAKGAILACEFIINKTGFFDMQAVLNQTI